MTRKVLLLGVVVLMVAMTWALAEIPGIKTDGTEVLPVKEKPVPIVKLGKGSVLYPMGVMDTLIWTETPNVNFGGWTDDYFAEYFVPAADGVLKAIIFRMSDLPDEAGGGMTVWIYDNNYPWPEVTTVDIAGSSPNCWLGYYQTSEGKDAFGEPSEWVKGGINDVTGIADKIYDPLGAKLWPFLGGGSVTLEPNANDRGDVVFELSSMGTEFTFTQGDTFLVLVKFTGFAGTGDKTEHRMGFYSVKDAIEPQPGLKFYSENSSPDGRTGKQDWGWHIREYVWDWRCVVEYTGDRGPQILDYTVLYATLSTDAITIEANIIDDNPSGGDAGVAHAYVVYSVNGGEETEVEMTESGGVYSADIPGQEPGSEITYYVKAVDVAGLETKSKAITYVVYKPVHPTLFIYDDVTLLGYEWYYWYGADTAGVYPYDEWYPNYGPISTELLGNYEIIYHVMGSGPENQPMNIGSIYKTWLDGATSDVPRRLFISGQDYGYISGFDDTTFADGTFEKDYLGIETLGPQDINYDGTAESYTTRKYAIDPVEGDVLTGYLYDYAGDSLQLFYDPYFEVGFYNWIDNLTPTSNATVCFTDPNTGGAAVAVHNEGENWKTVFWPLDPLALSFYDPADTSSKYHWVLTDVGNPLQKVLGWFGLPVLSVEPVGEAVPKAFVLKQNYPNPFNPTTTIEFSIPTNLKVTLSVYNVLGQKVRTLVNDRLPAKHYRVLWDGTDDRGNLVPSGVYFYTIRTDGFSATKKMILMK